MPRLAVILIVAVTACTPERAACPELPEGSTSSGDVEVEATPLGHEEVVAPSGERECLSVRALLASAELGEVGEVAAGDERRCVEGPGGTSCIYVLEEWNPHGEIVVIEEGRDGELFSRLAYRNGRCWVGLGAISRSGGMRPGESVDIELNEMDANENEVRLLSQIRWWHDSNPRGEGGVIDSYEWSREIVCRRAETGHVRCGWFVRYGAHSGDAYDVECWTWAEERLGRLTQRHTCREDERPVSFQNVETPPDLESVLERGLEGLVRQATP